MFLSSAAAPLSSSTSAAPVSAATPAHMPTCINIPTSPAASSDSAAVATAVADPQYFAYCLEAAALLHNLGTHHHDRGTEGSDDAMRSYSESIQIRIKAQDVAEAAAKRYMYHHHHHHQQQAPAEAAIPTPADDRPTQHEMVHRLAQLRSQSAQLRRAAADRTARAGASHVYPHDVPANLRRGETSMVGLNAFARPLLLPASNGLGPATTTTRGHGEFTSSTSCPFQATADASTSINTSSSGIGSSGSMYQQQQRGATTTWSTTATNIATANQPPTSKRRGGLKRPTPSYHSIDSSAPSAYTYPADYSTQSSDHDPTHLSSEVQKVNSLAAFTLYNIGLLHQTDRSNKEAQESYEIATTMLQSVPPHLGQCTTVPLLRIMLRNNLGYVAYRTRQYDAAAEHFQVASNASLDLSMLYAPMAVTVANPILEDEGVRTSRRRLGRSSVAILCNLSLALDRLGRNPQDVLDVSNAALQLSTRMEEDEVRYRQAVVAATAAAAIINNLYHSPSPTGTSPTTPNDDDDDGLDLSILPYVRARAHHGVRDGVTAMQQYRSFLSIVERSGRRSSHPYSVAAMQQVLTLSQSDALEAVEEMLRRVGDDHAAAAA